MHVLGAHVHAHMYCPYGHVHTHTHLWQKNTRLLEHFVYQVFLSLACSLLNLVCQGHGRGHQVISSEGVLAEERFGQILAWGIIVLASWPWHLVETGNISYHTVLGSFWYLAG